ncbi:Signal recognition particle receptor protein FtsY (=alpha subunit) (TC 3.A.5.1.1) [Halomonas citrativorans]|uniref:Signal recognition particle receptor FtsY n=1 Tax=Halomonas citrativorans TaxID=2742612 RepID=A0A1R4I305_9GAMM|nr:signal recognition particle-docking protein FtsY [Halomonas citrativorans]SJN14175.1 Signal recognition particle receptor protein FtsY (=alpha subunit) (TC 3.A.5.1.1) [Halomonas citrativorans]
MFGFFKRKKKHDSQQEPQEQRPQELNDDAQLDEPPQEPLADVENVAPVTEPEPEVEPAPAPPEIKPEPPEPEVEVEPAPAPSEVKPEPPEPEVEPAPVPPEVKPEPPEPEIKPAREPDTSPVPEPEVDPEPAEPDVQPEIQPEQKPALQEKPGEKKGWFARIKSGLGKTRANLTDGIADLFLGKKQIDDELLEDLETQLLMADVGIEATSEIIGRLEARVSRKELNNPEALYRALQEELAAMLGQVATPLDLNKQTDGPFVILVVGVNGVGKTTTIGKLTQRFQREGKSVMLAAGDTFRAAAVEQLKVWGERNSVPVIAQHTGADSASVIYDAVAAAKARGVDILIADTAGRLHNKSHLMEELKKVHRVMQKLDTTAPHEVMLVLDAGTGQNAIAQASTFNEAVPITGITLTKLDGTAKGGIIFALAKQLEMPIRFIGVGEGLDDLRPFEADDFVSALFDRQGDDASA